ncbi:hypothetical protein CAPTEDRAFT_162455 [Capitella teleta]|uniref:Protein NATD1 n=1 Tax=Capitella teleta TaxID=283909 RepID=R7T480_CAPTE|nr:hypothetical protein CAPTEDRAFT_162455 [Capitella teleta]|eukprot:ELT87742.1 hypothetical protein CAPTEDRAFT_162455 [Capitella teleta]
MNSIRRLLLRPGIASKSSVTQFLPSREPTASIVGPLFRSASFGGVKMAENKMSSVDELSYESVQHDAKKKEFFIAISHGDRVERAFIQYDINGKSIDLYHTLVPPVFRGKGVAKLLTKKALDHAIENDLHLIPSCSYVAKYIQDNPLPEYTSRM